MPSLTDATPPHIAAEMQAMRETNGGHDERPQGARGTGRNHVQGLPNYTEGFREDLVQLADTELNQHFQRTKRSVHFALHRGTQVLGKCQLREAISEKEEGLNSLVMQDGSNWSLGQRQLFCLGRALLKKSQILVLDEATASIDNATDSIIQKTIRTELTNCTVITVAHRIPTVMDCTKVLSISDGKIVEYDEPLKLMSMEGSLFGQLVKEYWSHSASGSVYLEN
ncbi:ABC transporter C family member 10 [Quercus suber]|uniref:ABC transporter C family member 10 n=1 Tax=Quercus suber TaxID=58331 RepID=UPI0032DF4698